MHTPCQDFTLPFHKQANGASWPSSRVVFLVFCLLLSVHIIFSNIFPELIFTEARAFSVPSLPPFLFAFLPRSELLITSLIVIILEITTTFSTCLLSRDPMVLLQQGQLFSSPPLLWVTEGNSRSKATAFLVFREAGEHRKEGTWLCNLLSYVWFIA